MRAPRIVDAMGYIDDDLVAWAVSDRSVPRFTRLRRIPFLQGCACFLVLVLVVGIALFRGEDGNQVSPPLTLTAYAVSPEDGSTTANALVKGEQVPVSTFETSTGLRGFVFSSDKTDPTQVSSIAIISAGDYDTQIDEIVDIADDPTQNYYIYIPGEDETEPYTFSLLISDEKTDSVYQYQITIAQIGSSYYATLVEENVLSAL